MAYELSTRLVIGLSSSALFDLEESDQIFRTDGEAKYREYQLKHQDIPLKKGVAFHFIEKLLSINSINPQDPPIEVILLSRNDPDTGLRVMNSIDHYGIGITRALFLQGRAPHIYIDSLSVDLFLSANNTDVNQAIIAGYPAGQVLKSNINEYKYLDHHDVLRIALDFDGVIADDEAEAIYKSGGINAFHSYEKEHVNDVHKQGPLAKFLQKLSEISKQEIEYAEKNNDYTPKLRISIVTARNAPSHKRVINTLRKWNVQVNEAFFLGGIDKGKILEVLNPHIFFDDQKVHLDNTVDISPSVHIPFGIRNN